MKLFKRLCAVAALLIALSPIQALAAATLLPNGEQCFQATAGVNGMIGLLGTITGGSGGTAGTYGGVLLTGGSGTGATANITVSGGAVTAVTILNPGINYVAADVLSAASGSIGSVSGFSVPVSSISINSSLAGGSVTFYYPGTNTFKQTWFNFDATTAHQNTNPVALDANGCAIIYGTGTYRQVLKDSLGNTVWDQLTTDTSANGSIFWAGTASGTPNAITIVDAGFNGTDGSTIEFVVLNTNTGAATLNPSSFGAIPILKATSLGPVAVASGDLVASNIVTVVYSASANSFQVLSSLPASTSTASVSPPEGYLTLVSSASGGPIQTGDVTSAAAVYYSPYVGNQIPIYNGASFVPSTFAELTLTLTGAFLASTAYDVCVFLNSGTPTIVASPAWSNSAAGTSARGTGAGSAQLQRVQGFWTNAVQISAINGASTYTVPANQCTVVGSILIDGSPGVISSYRSFGQSRKWGVWNFYNRQLVTLQVGDSTSSWIFSNNSWRPSNNAPANSGTVFIGLPEEAVNANFNQNLNISTSTTGIMINGIGWNSTTVPSGKTGTLGVGAAATINVISNGVASYTAAPALGTQTVTCLEHGPAAGTATWGGGNDQMIMTLSYRG